MKHSKLPPFGKPLAERLRYGNLPYLVVVFVGLDSWQRAKDSANRAYEVAPLVLPAGEDPSRYKWPVSHCDCVIERLDGPDNTLVANIALELLQAGANFVAVLWADWRAPFTTYRSDGSPYRLINLKKSCDFEAWKWLREQKERSHVTS